MIIVFKISLMFYHLFQFYRVFGLVKLTLVALTIMLLLPLFISGSCCSQHGIFCCCQLVVVVVKWLWLLSNGCGCCWCQGTWSIKDCCCLCPIAISDQPLPALPFSNKNDNTKIKSATLCFSWLQDDLTSHSVFDNQRTPKSLHAWHLWFPSYKCTLLHFK